MHNGAGTASRYLSVPYNLYTLIAYSFLVVNFTQSLHHDTYPAIDPRKADHSGRNVMVTGASSGCGKAMAMAYAEAGASTIVLLARRDLSEVKQEIELCAENTGRAKPTVMCLSVDQTNQAQVEAAASQVKDTLGHLDILINNAGYLETWKPITDSDPEDWWRTWEVNIKGPYLICRSFIPLLLARPEGLKTIVQITSLGGLATGPGASGYQMTKTAIIRFNNYLRIEYGSKGLLAYALHPGAVKTALSLGMPKVTQGMLIDTLALGSHTVVWLTQKRREWLQDRFVSAVWDMEQLEARSDEIVEKNLLRFSMAG